MEHIGIYKNDYLEIKMIIPSSFLKAFQRMSITRQWHPINANIKD
jgi:hypothetical protein